MTSEDLAGLRTKIAGALARRPEYFVTQPTELRVLQAMTRGEVQDFARENGWQMVRRLGGLQYQFYNDAFARLTNAESEN